MLYKRRLLVKNSIRIKNSLTIYEPDNSINKGYLNIFKEITREIKLNHWLTFQLFKRDFLALYKQSFIGVFWALIIPLISVGTFIILNSSGIFIIGDLNVPYPIYAILGMAFWQIFAVGIISSSNSLVKAGSMIIRINFSKKSLVMASFGQSFVPFLIQLFLLIILFFTYQITPKLTILLIPLFLIPLILLTLGLGFILSILNGVVRDVGNALSFLITFFMFLTPVLYEKPNEGILTSITKYNPIYYLIQVPREIILMGNSTEWKGYIISCISSLIVFITCIIIFHLTETRVAERI